MITIIIDTKTDEAKKMVELLKSTRYAKIIDQLFPNKETIKAVEDAKNDIVKSYTSITEMTSVLKEESVST